MRKALLTGTAAIALGMFGYGVTAASASSFLSNIPVAVATGGSTASSTNVNHSANGALSHDLNGNQVNGNGNTGRSATAVDGSTANSTTTDTTNVIVPIVGSGNSGRSATVVGDGTATSNTQDNSGRSATVNGDGTADSNSGNQNLGAQGLLFDSQQVGNGVLAISNSDNHVHVDVTLASAHAGGSVSGDVANDNQTGSPPDDAYSSGRYNNGSDVTNVARDATGVFVMNASGNGITQGNTSISIGAVDTGGTIVSH